jgi:hypothetical protein
MPELRQCAWCLLVKDRTGAYRLQPGKKIAGATHGICPSCKGALLAEIEHTTSPVLVAA